MAIRLAVACAIRLLPFAVYPLPLAICPPVAAAQPPPPQLTQPVNDFAGVIDEASARELDRRIRALHAATGDAVVVATIRTFQPYADIESYAVKMFENGGKGIGERGKDNGLLMLVAVDDRRARIEVGYDLEEFITDGYAGETIRTALLPQFREGNYGPGLLTGATRVINRIAERRGVTLQDVPRERRQRPPTATVPGVGGLAFVGFILLLLLLGRFSGGRRRRRRNWGVGPWSGWNSGVGPFGRSSGGFGGGFGGFRGGGGFGGFGGGRSGGGGASGGWSRHQILIFIG